jgi:hypothetical protein
MDLSTCCCQCNYKPMYCDISTNCSSLVAQPKKKASDLLGNQGIGDGSGVVFLLLKMRTVGRNSTVTVFKSTIMTRNTYMQGAW